MMKKILVPTDFSLPAQYAADTAAGIAKKANAEVVLLHVIEQPGSDSFNIEGEWRDESEWEEKLFIRLMIDKVKTQLSVMAEAISMTGVTVSQQIRLGSPVHGILSVVSNQDIDLVVMGTSGKAALEELIVGSNTKQVVRQSQSPVLTVHQKIKNSTQNIVYATSLHENEKAFAGVVKETQALFGATVHLVRINTPVNFRPDDQVIRLIEAFAQQAGLSNYTCNTYNDLSEEEGIIHFATAINADLIAMSTHGRTGLAHLVVGSIAEDVANHAERPVLTSVTKRNAE